MTALQNNRWVAADGEFATRIEVPDVEGFFSKSVLVEPGFRALFLERGQSLGELPPGQHTLANIIDRMKFWTRKTATVIVARQQEVPIELNCGGLLTREFLEVEVAATLSVQIDDVALFFSNLMGSKSAVSIDETKEIVFPLFRQSLWETIGRLSIKDLAGEEARKDIENCVAQSLGTALTRYGLRFASVRTLSVSHPEYDAQRRRTGELWLQREQLDFDKLEAQLAADKLFAEIERQEKTDDLEVLAQNVAADRMEADLSVRMRRIGIRKQMREAALAGQFDRINSEEELAAFLQQRDKERLIRQDEADALAAALKDKGTDRTIARNQLLRKLEIEQQAELDTVRIDLNFAQKMQTRRHEIALADLNASDESRRWKERLERESAEAEHRRTEAAKKIEHDRKQALAQGTDRRDDEWQEMQHAQRISRLKGEIQLDQATTQQRVSLLQLETSKSHQTAALEMTRRKSELEREVTRNTGLDQIERLKQVQEMNLALARAQQEMKLADRRQEQELLVLKEDRAAQRQVDVMMASRGMSKYELLATSQNASIIADVMKHGASAKATVGVANAQAMASQGTSSREQALQQQLLDSQKENMDKVIAAYKEAMQGQQSGFQQFGTTIESVTRNLAPQPPQVIATGGGATSSPGQHGTSAGPPAGKKVILCPQCRTENEEQDRHCRRCGKDL